MTWKRVTLLTVVSTIFSQAYAQELPSTVVNHSTGAPRAEVNLTPSAESRRPPTNSKNTRHGQQRLRLPPPRGQGQTSGVALQGRDFSPLSTFTSLAIVLGIFLAFVAVTRRSRRHHEAHLPHDVLRVVGRISLTPKQDLHLVRLGQRLLLLLDGSQGMQSLAEIKDPDEVNRLTAMCDQHRPSDKVVTVQDLISRLNDRA